MSRALGRMPDSRFFETLAPMTVGEAAALVGAALTAGAADARLARVADGEEDDLDDAVVYCAKGEMLSALEGRRFGLCLTTRDLVGAVPAGGAAASANDPRLAFAQLAERFHRSLETTAQADIKDRSGPVHETAVIAAGAEIGDGARIGAHVFVGPGVVIGADCVLEAGVCVTHAILGKNVRVLTGARIGQAGFGFVPSEAGLVRVPQLGRVVIEDDVEVGANTTIDRGALGDTLIGRGTKIDNLVQIGHNVRIGEYCAIAAQTGVSGSCVIGNGVFMGGQVGLADHLTIGDGAQIAAGSGLMRDVPVGEKWGGRPAKLARDWLKETATLARLAKKK